LRVFEVAGFESRAPLFFLNKLATAIHGLPSFTGAPEIGKTPEKAIPFRYSGLQTLKLVELSVGEQRQQLAGRRIELNRAAARSGAACLHQNELRRVTTALDEMRYVELIRRRG